MYALKEARGTGIAAELLKLSLEFAEKYYKKCYLETLSNMTAANKFYKKHGFTQLEKPLTETEHYACDVWYVKAI
jgi:putative acetyltransferase